MEKTVLLPSFTHFYPTGKTYRANIVHAGNYAVYKPVTYVAVNLLKSLKHYSALFSTHK